MSIARKLLPGIAVGLAVAAAASPSFAQRGEDGMSGARAKALRDCSTMSDKFTQYTWGSTQLDQYRACMMQHGQPE
jgi:hypothetical protein